jgi:hypothetical protein
LIRRAIFGEFMMFSPVSVHQELSEKQNRQTIRSAACHFSGGDFIRRVSSPHIGRESSSQTKPP